MTFFENLSLSVNFNVLSQKKISRRCLQSNLNFLASYFFDREQRSNVLKEALLLLLSFLLFLAWKHVSKMFQIAVFGLYSRMWPFMPLCGLVWPCVASYGLDVASFELTWPCVY